MIVNSKALFINYHLKISSIIYSLTFVVQNKIVIMKKLFLLVAASYIFFSTEAQQLTTPQPSPTANIKQNFALSSIEISFSRPGVKGRKIFGDLVPYGKVWRTGANNATTITFGEEVMIGGKKVPAGKYGLLSIPGEAEWTFIITKQTDVTSPADYKQDQDVVRITAKPQTLPFSIETMMINIDNIKSNSCTIGLVWDNVFAGFDVTSDVESKVMAQIKNAMENDNKPYFNAALYYIDNGKDLNKAIEWLDKAYAQNPEAFWVLYQKARAQKMLGKKTDAMATSNKSIEIAKKAKNDDYVALNEKLQKEMK
jgi:tetratricopeptide (TPR) repeat protein